MRFRSLLLLVWTWYTIIAFIMTYQMVVPFLSIYSTEFLHKDLVFTGLLFTVFGVAAFAVRLPFAFLADKLGASLFVILGAVLMLASAVMLYLSATGMMLLYSRILAGCGFSMFEPAMISYIPSIRTRDISQRLFLTYATSGFPIGVTFGAAFGGVVVPLGFSTLFLASFLFGISMVVAVIILLFSNSKEKVQQRPESVSKDEGSKTTFQDEPRVRLTRSGLAVLLITRANLSYIMGMSTAFVPLFVVQVLAFPISTAGSLLALVGVSSLIARPVSTVLSRFWSDKEIMMFAISSILVSSLLLNWLPIKQLIWIVAFLWGLAGGLFIPMSIIQIIDSVPKSKRTQGLAFLTLMLDIGTALGPAASAIIFLYGGYFSVFAVASLVAVLTLILQSRTRMP